MSLIVTQYCLGEKVCVFENKKCFEILKNMFSLKLPESAAVEPMDWRWVRLQSRTGSFMGKKKGKKLTSYLLDMFSH